MVIVYLYALKVIKLSGIYIHIPFCKQACHYCDFHFSTNLTYRQKMVDKLCKELVMRKAYLSVDHTVETVYIGGGTPSLLSYQQIEQLLETVRQNFTCELKETTLEANPDDLNVDKLKGLKKLGIDRLSIGIQSFNSEILSFYNRAHTAEESYKAVDRAKQAGFEKLSIDLMYGFPYKDHSLWKKDLQLALEIDPGHISSYALTIEPNTALGKWTQKGIFEEASEDFVAEQFEMLQNETSHAGYLQYEISNFGKAGKFAIHNTNYWRDEPYLGIGPSAHSYDGKNRGSTISNNHQYMKMLSENQLPFVVDNLSATDRCNEYILTSLRTMWGCDLSYLQKEFGYYLTLSKQNLLTELQENELIEIIDQKLILIRKGKLLADSIASSLFI